MHRILKIDSDLQRVKKALWEARSQWKDIGRALDISDGTIRSIHEPSDGESLHHMLTLWMQSGTATIQDLLKALEDSTVGRKDIVNEILSRKGKCHSVSFFNFMTVNNFGHCTICFRD